METTTTGDLVRRLEAAERRSAATERKVRGAVFAALLVMAGLLAFALAPGAQAQKSSGSPLETRIAVLETQVATLVSENATQATQISQLQNASTQQAQQIASLESTNTALGNRIVTLEVKLAPVSVDQRDFIITGKNVHIVDGSGATNSASGLGNLTVGYNALRNEAHSPNLRSGSHNLILGNRNNYSSYGGLVVGIGNTISGPYASVSGGYHNTASNYAASVSGGFDNAAGGSAASVSGGKRHSASSAYDWAAGSLFEDE